MINNNKPICCGHAALKLKKEVVINIIESGINRHDINTDFTLNHMFVRDFFDLNFTTKLLNANDINTFKVKSSQNFQYLDLIFENVSKLENIELKQRREGDLFKLLLENNKKFLKEKTEFLNNLEIRKLYKNNLEINEIQEYIKLITNNCIIFNEKTTIYGNTIDKLIAVEVINKFNSRNIIEISEEIQIPRITNIQDLKGSNTINVQLMELNAESEFDMNNWVDESSKSNTDIELENLKYLYEENDLISSCFEENFNFFYLYKKNIIFYTG